MQKIFLFFTDSCSTRRSLSVFALTLLALCTLSASAQTISSISPNYGPVLGGNTIRIFGSGFDSSTTVWIWANQATVAQFVSSSEIDVVAPSAPYGGPGAEDVAVFSNGGVFRLANGYTYVADQPAPSPPPPPSPSPSPNPGPATGSALSACADITRPGAYYLTQDVSSGGTCFFIDADNVTLNLNGYTITYATSGGSQPAPGVLLADDWYTGYGIAQSGSTEQHGNFEIFGGNIIESSNGPARSPAIWVGQSNDITPLPRIHDLTLKTYTEDSSPIFGTLTGGGWQIYNNNIYYLATSTSSRYRFYGQAIWLGDNEQAATPTADQIYSNHIFASPQGGVRDTHQNAKIYNNDITFNSTYTNDFCVDAPADYQEVYGNNCHPVSGRGIHTDSSNVYIHGNTISVTELKQNAEYGGCELAGAFGVQVEFNSDFKPSPPTGVRVANNTISAVAGDCDAVGLRMTSMQGIGSVTYTNNVVTTTNQGGSGNDYALSFSAVIEAGGNFQYSGNTFSSQHAYVTADWDGAYVEISAGQNWNGSPQWSIDNENGYNEPSGPKFLQSITVDDSTPGSIHCGGNANGYNRDGSQTLQCNNLGGNPI